MRDRANLDWYLTCARQCQSVGSYDTARWWVAQYNRLRDELRLPGSSGYHYVNPSLYGDPAEVDYARQSR